MTRNYNLPILVSLVALFSINMLMISSLAPNLILRQLSAWIIGLILFFLGRQLNPKQDKKTTLITFIGSCFLLILPILLNNITRGSRRWIDIGPLNLQPSEVVKPFLMLVLANTNFPLIHLFPVFLIMLQPDLGSAISVLFLITPLVLYNKKLFKIAVIGAVLLALASPIIWSSLLHDYQRSRITQFLNPGSDPLGKGYNVIQSKIAIGSGGLFGKGYRKGTQGQLLFLPEKHTDFIFAATAEELGVLGIAIILTAYYILLKTLLNKAFSTTNNRPLFLFTLGVVFQVWMQLFINIGMNVGILPVTGIPLPFLSVGGSSLMSLLLSLGIIFSS